MAESTAAAHAAAADSYLAALTAYESAGAAYLKAVESKDSPNAARLAIRVITAAGRRDSAESKVYRAAVRAGYPT